MPALECRSPGRVLPRIGAARIATRADGRYLPRANGQWAVILAIHDRHGELDDLVAWYPRSPCAWWLRFGDCPVLGAHELAIAAYYHRPVKVFSTPERWLLAGGVGTCVLCWDVDIRSLFEGVPRAECDTPELQRRLLQRLRRWEPTVVLARRDVRHVA